MPYRLLLPLFMLFALSACQALDLREDARKLDATLTSYATTVRWQPLAEMYAFLRPDLQPQQPPANLGNVRVTGYEISAPPREIAKGKVVQTAVIEYVLVDRQQVRSLVDNQLWTRTDDGQWLRANPIPAFR